MKRRNFNKSILQQGGLMIEALAMLGLIAVVTPTMYKKSAERTMEVEDINTAATIRTINAAANDYVSANYSTILGDMVKNNETNRKLNIEDLKAYLPYGFDIKKALYNYDGEHIQLSVSRPDGSNNLTTLMLFPAKLDEENGIGQERTSRIAALIGSSGGYVTDTNKARGIGGIWELSGDSYTKNFNSANKYSIVTASADTISASAGNEMDYSKYLQRGKDAGDDEGQWKNTMRTDLYMGGPDTSTEDVYHEATGPWSIRNINRLIVGTDYVGGNKETEDATNYSLYVAGNKPNTYLSGTLEAVNSDFKVLQNQLSFGRTVTNPDADPAAQTKSDYAFTIANNGDTSTRGQLIVDRNVTLAGSAGFWNDVKIGVIDKYPSATEPNYGIRIKPFADKTSEKDNNDAPWGRVTFFADNIMQINNTGNNDVSASDDDRILIMNDGIKELPDGTAVPKISYTENGKPTFPVRIGSNAKVEGVLAAGQIDTQKIRAASLSVGSENIDDENKWMTVDKDGILITKNSTDTDGNTKSGTRINVNKDQISLRVDATPQSIINERGIESTGHAGQIVMNNTGTVYESDGSERTVNAAITITSPTTDIRGTEDLTISGKGTIVQAMSENSKSSADTFKNTVPDNTLLLRNDGMQMKMSSTVGSVKDKDGNANPINISETIFSPRNNSDSAHTRTSFRNMHVDLKDSNFRIVSNWENIFSVRGNDNEEDKFSSNNNDVFTRNIPDFPPTNEKIINNYDVALHGNIVVAPKTPIGSSSYNPSNYYANVSIGTLNKMAGVNILDKRYDYNGKLSETASWGHNANQHNVVIIDQGFDVNTDYNNNNKKDIVDPGTVYIRKGYVEVHGDDSVLTSSDKDAYQGNGVLVASRLVANNPIQARDVTHNIPERGSHITEFVDSSMFGNGSNHYDTYMVNPAYTSVMHDIKLTTRGGARLSDILPDFINKGIYVVSNTMHESSVDKDFTFHGYDKTHDIQTIEPTKKINFTETEAWASPFLGAVPAPQCPPGYGRVITLSPYSFEMAQAGVLNKTTRSATTDPMKEGLGNSYYVMPVNNANEVKSSLTPPEYAKANVALDADSDIRIDSTNNNIGTIDGTLKKLDGLSTQQYVLSSPTATDSSTTPVKPLFFQQSTRIKSATIPLLSGEAKTSIETTQSYLTGKYVKGWAAIIGFIYPAKMYSSFTNKDEEGFYWNLFPVMRGTINGYATVYCYFDRTNMYGKYNDNYSDYVDRQDYMKTMTGVPDDHSKTDSNYTKRLNDPNLKYDEVW